MTPREKKFCRLMTVLADPRQAAQEAGYKHPEEEWPELLGRGDIADEISRRMRNIRSVYESTAICGIYRLAYGGNSDVLRLMDSAPLTTDELRAIDLRCVSEIKRTKDKSVEIKFFDRIKAAEKLATLYTAGESSDTASGLLDAMRLSAEALGNMYASEVGGDEV